METSLDLIMIPSVITMISTMMKTIVPIISITVITTMTSLIQGRTGVQQQYVGQMDIEAPRDHHGPADIIDMAVIQKSVRPLRTDTMLLRIPITKKNERSPLLGA